MAPIVGVGTTALTATTAITMARSLSMEDGFMAAGIRIAIGMGAINSGIKVPGKTVLGDTAAVGAARVAITAFFDGKLSSKSLFEKSRRLLTIEIAQA
jgi:hypothetical protein